MIGRIVKVFISLCLGLIFGLTGFVGSSYAAEVTQEVIPQSPDPGAYYPGTGVAIKAGDILVTNNTKPSGLTGHAAIVINTAEVVEIQGFGYKMIKRPIADFFAANATETKGVKIVRYFNSATAQNAATWALNYYQNYKDTVTYNISDLYNYQNETYCSKIVFNAYKYGGGVELPTSWLSFGGTYIKVCVPYDLLSIPNGDIVGVAGKNF